jgi:hypothetical protein
MAINKGKKKAKRSKKVQADRKIVRIDYVPAEGVNDEEVKKRIDKAFYILFDEVIKEFGPKF